VPQIFNRLLAAFNLRVVRSDQYFNTAFRLTRMIEIGRELHLELACLANQLNFRDLIQKSYSQINQDVFVISQLKGIRSGFFVEFGATDGVSLSNTYQLEKGFDWNGILVEPGRNWKEKLAVNRGCHKDFRCVTAKSGDMVQFMESTSPELSTIQGFEYIDENQREIIRDYYVETISLEDLLDAYKAPQIIDYLSIDTEGSEFLILENFNFDKYGFKVITCEHNFTENREKILKLLTKNGYKRVWSEFTQFDDWYVNPKLI
jgi:FkbM family methyltransferase